MEAHLRRYEGELKLLKTPSYGKPPAEFNVMDTESLPVGYGSTSFDAVTDLYEQLVGKTLVLLDISISPYATNPVPYAKARTIVIPAGLTVGSR